MSSNNNDNGAAAGLAFMMAGLTIIGLFIFAVLAFLACILTLLSVVILIRNKPFKIGKESAGPKEAREFILGGVIGAVIVPVFLAFCSGLFDIHVNWDYLWHFVGCGYVAGPICHELFRGNNENETPAPYIPPQPQLPAPAKRPLFYDEADPFRFASWDDEEKRK
jgi:hypothetical protein